MGYKEVRRASKNAILVDQYMSARYGGPGKRRAKKRKPTPEEMKKINMYTKIRKVLWRIQLYFEEGDLYLTLTYKRENRPKDMKEAKEHFKKFREKLRKEYKKRGIEFRWIRNIEVGSRGAWHIHMILKRFDGIEPMIAKLWKMGKVDYQIMTEEGGFRKLAAYITKTPDTDSRLRESDFDCSRNMTLPEPEVKHIKSWSIHRKIRVPKGWYLDPDSLREGINPITGYDYRSYMLLREGTG